MRASCYLIIKRKKPYWKDPGIRVTRKTPSLEPNERAVMVTLDIPDALWEEPQLRADIVVPKDAVSNPVIDAQVIENIQEAISQQLGVSLQIAVVEPDNDEL